MAAMEKNNKTLNVPHLRFPEFSGEWEKCTLGDFGKIITGNTPPTADEKNYDNGTHLWASPADLGTTKYIESTQTLLSDIGFEKTRTFPSNSILVTCIGSTIGKMGMSKIEMASNQQINTIVPVQHDVNFVYYAVQSRFPRYLSSIAVQAVPILSKSAFEKLSNFTTSKEEQTKIGNLLALIDERIDTQKKIIEDLKKLKDAISKSLLSRSDLLERMIPLSQVGMLKNGYAFQSSSYDSSGEYEIITIANVTGERYISTEGCNRIHTTPSDLQLHQKLKDGDILISLTGNVGRVSLCNKEGKYLLNQRVGLLELQVGVNREFVYQAISSPKFERGMSSCGQGAAQMNIGKGDVENFVIPYSNNTQNLQRISLILKGYDELVLIESKRFQFLQSQKRYFISTLFI